MLLTSSGIVQHNAAQEAMLDIRFARRKPPNKVCKGQALKLDEAFNTVFANTVGGRSANRSVIVLLEAIDDRFLF